jgi:hypothetical protein
MKFKGLEPSTIEATFNGGTLPPPKLPETYRNSLYPRPLNAWPVASFSDLGQIPTNRN